MEETPEEKGQYKCNADELNVIREATGLAVASTDSRRAAKQYLNFDDVLGITVEMLKLKQAEWEKEDEVAQVCFTCTSSLSATRLRLKEILPSTTRMRTSARAHTHINPGKLTDRNTRAQAFSTLGGSDTAAIQGDTLKNFVKLFDLDIDALLGEHDDGDGALELHEFKQLLTDKPSVEMLPHTSFQPAAIVPVCLRPSPFLVFHVCGHCC